MAVNKIVQRLIAAGASPDRAQQFAQDFAKKQMEKTSSAQIRPGVPGTPGVPGARPKDIQDAFDAELAAYSAAQWPNTFKPQSLTDAQRVQYVIGVYGQDKYDSLTQGVYNKYAPTYLAAFRSQNQILNTAAKAAQAGVPVGESISTVRSLYLTNPDLFGGLTEDDAVKQVNKIYNEYGKASGYEKTAVNDFLKNDKYYKVNLPHPNLKYGETTDLSSGVIDFRTHPAVPGVIEKRTSKLAPLPEGAGPLARSARSMDVGMVEPKVFADLSTTGASPFFDEVTRRESLKKKTTLGR